MLKKCAKLNPNAKYKGKERKTVAAWRLPSSVSDDLLEVIPGTLGVLREDCYV